MMLSYCSFVLRTVESLEGVVIITQETGREKNSRLGQRIAETMADRLSEFCLLT